MHTYRIVVGDWSDDGHSQKDFYTVKTSHEIGEMQKAYVEAVKQYKVALDDTTPGADYRICCDYEDNTIPEEVVEIFNQFTNWEFAENELEDDGSLGASPKDIGYLFMEMIKTQIDGFTYEFVYEPPTINGFWGNLNINIGYGCYD